MLPTVNVIIGQRLVRRVAEERETYKSNAIETQCINDTIGRLLPKTREEQRKVSADLGYKDLPLAGQKAYTLVKAKTRRKLRADIKGRVGLYEVMEVTERSKILLSSTQQAPRSKEWPRNRV